MTKPSIYSMEGFVAIYINATLNFISFKELENYAGCDVCFVFLYIPNSGSAIDNTVIAINTCDTVEPAKIDKS